MEPLNEMHNAIINIGLQNSPEKEPTSEREQALQAACDILLDYALAVKRVTELTVDSEADKSITSESNNESQIDALHETLELLQVPNLDRAGHPTDGENHSGGAPDELCDSLESLQSLDTADSVVDRSPRPTTAASSCVLDDVDNETNGLSGDRTRLTYHPDAIGLRFDGRHLFRPDALLKEPPRSRRVLLGGLPSDVKLPQLMLGLRDVQGILSANMVPPHLAHPISCNGGLIEFDSCESAYTFLQSTKCQPPRYADSHGYVVTLEAQLINTDSYHTPNYSLVPGFSSRTRTVCFPNVTVEMAWSISSALPCPGQIVAIEYADSMPCLYVQFSSVGAAMTAWETCNYGILHTERFWKVRVECHCALDSIFNSEGNLRACVPLIATDLKSLLLNGSTVQPPKFPLEAPALSCNISDSSRGHTKPENRFHLSEVQPAPLSLQSDPVYTKATLEQLAKERKKMIEQMKWDAYGKLAKHRREMATTNCITPSSIAACDGTCQFSCQPLQNSPPADVIKEYLSIHQPSYADTGIEGF